VTVYSFAELPRLATKVQKIADAVVSQSANDLLASIKISPGINRGGSRVRGEIPRDLGALASSLQSSLHGSTSITGQESYVLVAGQMTAGSVATFAWGGAAAPYSRQVHYGANGVPGTFWIDAASNRWVQIVNGVVARVKSAIK